MVFLLSTLFSFRGSLTGRGVQRNALGKAALNKVPNQAKVAREQGGTGSCLSVRGMGSVRFNKRPHPFPVRNIGLPVHSLSVLIE